MRPFALTLFAAVVTLAPAVARAAEPAPPGALTFGKTCSGCHTVGEGDRAGPDLLGVTQRRTKAWMATFVRSPGAVIDAGDPVANELLKKFNGLRMPDQALSDAQFEEVHAWLAACAEQGGCKIVLGTVKHAAEATREDVAAGKARFEASCLGCHEVAGAGIAGGGTFGGDLSQVYAKLGDEGTQTALGALKQPVHRAHRLDDAAQFALKGYLASVSSQGGRARADANFLYLGVIGLAVALGAIGLVWNHRLRGVRGAIVVSAKRGHA